MRLPAAGRALQRLLSLRSTRKGPPWLECAGWLRALPRGATEAQAQPRYRLTWRPHRPSARRSKGQQLPKECRGADQKCLAVFGQM